MAGGTAARGAVPVVPALLALTVHTELPGLAVAVLVALGIVGRATEPDTRTTRPTAKPAAGAMFANPHHRGAESPEAEGQAKNVTWCSWRGTSSGPTLREGPRRVNGQSARDSGLPQRPYGRPVTDGAGRTGCQDGKSPRPPGAGESRRADAKFRAIKKGRLRPGPRPRPRWNGCLTLRELSPCLGSSDPGRHPAAGGGCPFPRTSHSSPAATWPTWAWSTCTRRFSSV